jgi:methylmalonyl-CoA/ethylmalonyl-CoA epimerase
MAALRDTKLAQVAIVVADMLVSRARFAALLGVAEPEIIETLPGEEVRLNYRGRSTNAKARLAFFDLGGVQLELIQPIGIDSAWAEDLDAKGERVHHLAFWTDDMKETVATLDEHGAPLIMRGDMGEGQYAYFDGVPQFGVMLEILEHKRTELD